MIPEDLHIYTWAPEDERQHELAADCWCDPAKVRPERSSIVGLRIIAHTGLPQPSVVKSMDVPVRLFAGNLGRGRVGGYRGPAV